MYTAPIIFNKRLKVQFFLIRKYLQIKKGIEYLNILQRVLKSVNKKGYENLEIEDENTGNENSENKVLVDKLLNCYTRQEQEVLNFLFFERYSGQAVVETLGMSRQQVHSIKHKAFEKIRENINFVINKKTSIMRNKQ